MGDLVAAASPGPPFPTGQRRRVREAGSSRSAPPWAGPPRGLPGIGRFVRRRRAAMEAVECAEHGERRLGGGWGPGGAVGRGSGPSPADRGRSRPAPQAPSAS